MKRLLRHVLATPPILMSLAIYQVGVILFAVWLIWDHRNQMLEQIDRHLQIAARGADLIVPADLIVRVERGETLPAEASAACQKRLEALRRTIPDVSGVALLLAEPGPMRLVAGTASMQRQWQEEAIVHREEVAYGVLPENYRLSTTLSHRGHYRQIELFRRTPDGHNYLLLATAELGQLNRRLLVYAPQALLYGVFFLFLAAPLLLTYARTWQKKRHELEAAQLAAERARLQEEAIALEFLRFQLNPHFLFNALNSICALIPGYPRRAEEMTMRLSRFCRSSIFARNHAETSLDDNLTVAHDYLDIEAVRWGERLQPCFDIQVADPARILTPSFLLQPLLENAVKYGQRSGVEVLRILVRAWSREATLYLEVENSGRWFEAHESVPRLPEATRFGLDNLRRRLELYYGPGDYLRHAIDEEAGLVRFTLTLPLRRSQP